MKKDMLSLNEVKELIKQGKQLILAGDEKILQQLPPGAWIAGTIPYFMGQGGCLCSQDKIFVTTIPEYVTKAQIRRYTKDNLNTVYTDAPANGFSVIIIPAFSEVAVSFAMNVHTYKNFAAKPLIGWASGILLKDSGKAAPKVFDGTAAACLDQEAVVFHVELPKGKRAEIDIINIFKPGKGDEITFPQNALSAKEVFINGKKANFAEYISKNKIDTKLPIVADMFGATINTSFREVNQETGEVHFYAPVFQGVTYRFAVPVGDYIKTFIKQVPKRKKGDVFFSCNCILNYLYAKLEGKKTGGLTGPITFGEIAYKFLNQTLAYLLIYEE